MKEDLVILVDKNDCELGFMPKTEAHLKAELHRAVSVFIVNTEGKWLLQRRAHSKYHSSGLWTNTCCTHPLPNESNNDAASRRLLQEMGMQCTLNELFSFMYKEVLDNELTENELDHVFWGVSDSVPIPNPNEVAEYRYISFHDLTSEINKKPETFTVWFKKIVEQVHQQISQNKPK